MRIHEIKTYSKHWIDIRNEAKTFDIRKDDRDYQKGDILKLKEFDAKTKKYTGREQSVLVIYKVHGFGLIVGYCALGIIPIGKLTDVPNVNNTDEKLPMPEDFPLGDNPPVDLKQDMTFENPPPSGEKED